MTVAVVTDSTAYLPEGCARHWGIRVVPLHVTHSHGRTVPEGDFGSAELAHALTNRERVTTAGATPEELARAYREALAAGAEAVVAVHLSQRLSSTCGAAHVAARTVDPQRVRVVDSRSAAMGIGFPVLAAAEAAEAGADAEEVERIALAASERTTTLFSVPNLEHLHQGGRIGAAATLFGTALSIKPLLRVHQGRIEPVEKVRTMSKALARLVEIAARSVARDEDETHGYTDVPVRLAVHHLAAPDRAADLADRLRARVRATEQCVVSEVGAVIGAHIGPGSVGVVAHPVR